MRPKLDYDRSRLVLMIPAETKKRLVKLGEAKGVPYGQLARHAIMEYVARAYERLRLLDNSD